MVLRTYTLIRSMSQVWIGSVYQASIDRRVKLYHTIRHLSISKELVITTRYVDISKLREQKRGLINAYTISISTLP